MWYFFSAIGRKIICELHCVSKMSFFFFFLFLNPRSWFAWSPAPYSPFIKKMEPDLGTTGEGNSPYSWRHFGCLSLDIKHKPQPWWRHCGGPHLARLRPAPLFGLNETNVRISIKSPTYPCMSGGWHGRTPPFSQQLWAFCFWPPLRHLIHHISRISRFTALFDMFIYLLIPFRFWMLSVLPFQACWVPIRTRKILKMLPTPFLSQIAWHGIAVLLPETQAAVRQKVMWIFFLII